MLIDITNTCKMNCPHCMQKSTELPQHMDFDTFSRSLEVARTAGARCILISGGEPTMHPNWESFVEKAANRFDYVCLITNGAWLGDKLVEDNMMYLFGMHKNFKVQITSIKGLYREYDRISSQVVEFKKRLKDAGYKKRITFETGPIHMLTLGRATEHDEFRKAAREDNQKGMSCLSTAIIAAQVDKLSKAISIMEPRGLFCHPMIDWMGNMHWSESWLCPSFASVNEPYGDIERKALSWRPCGKCEDYKKFLSSTNPKYQMARVIFAMPKI